MMRSPTGFKSLMGQSLIANCLYTRRRELKEFCIGIGLAIEPGTDLDPPTVMVQLRASFNLDASQARSQSIPTIAPSELEMLQVTSNPSKSYWLPCCT